MRLRRLGESIHRRDCFVAVFDMQPRVHELLDLVEHHEDEVGR